MIRAFRVEERRHDGKLLGVVGFYADEQTAFDMLHHRLRVSGYLYAPTADQPRRLVVKVV